MIYLKIASYLFLSLLIFGSFLPAKTVAGYFPYASAKGAEVSSSISHVTTFKEDTKIKKSRPELSCVFELSKSDITLNFENKTFTEVLARVIRVVSTFSAIPPPESRA